MVLRRETTAAVALVGCIVLLVAPLAEAAGPPAIGTAWVTDVTATGANLRATINANGLTTKYRFEYITQAAYDANLSAVPPREGFVGAAKVPSGLETGIGSGTSLLPVIQHVGGLTPVTAYRYRPVATNSAGTSIGPEHVLATQETSLAFRLPDERGWEMVSPVDKGGGAIAAPGAIFGGGDFQAAAATPAVTYGSVTAFGNAAGAPPSSQYLSHRTASGWSTENVSTPLDSGAYGDEPDGAPYRVFSASLSRALLFGGLPCRGGLEGCPAPNPPLPNSGAPAGYMAYYLRDDSTGALLSLLHAADVAHSAVSPQAFAAAFAGASPDLSHVVLSSCAKLTADAVEVPSGPGRCDQSAPNLYAWSAAGLRAVNVLPGQAIATPGAALGASIGAVAEDGSRIYWSIGGDLYLRKGTQTVAVDESGGAEFQAAALDGSFAFFTTADDHLHRFSAATGAATDLTPAGGVSGVLGVSPDGGYVYFQDSTGLEAWHGGTTTTIAAGAGVAAPSDYPPATATARVSDGGTRLAFLSFAELNGYDNVDATSGNPDAELYVYGPPAGGGAAVLICASCNPTGERPQGSSSIPGSLANGSTRAYMPRALSADGLRLFFDSADALVVQDTNAAPDVYEWEAQGAGSCGRSPGCVSLISTGRSVGGASFVDASAAGDDVFFITDESLVGADPGSIDLYDARVGGGFAEAPKPIPCINDACQSLPGEPDDPTPGTLLPSSGNPPLQIARERRRRRSGERRRHGKRHHHGVHRKRGHGPRSGR